MKLGHLAMCQQHRTPPAMWCAALSPKLVVLSTGSAGTRGMIAGFHAMGCTIPILGIACASQSRFRLKMFIIWRWKQPLNRQPLSRDKVIVDDGYVGEGMPSPLKQWLRQPECSHATKVFCLTPYIQEKECGVDWSDTVRSDLKWRRCHFPYWGSVSLFAYEEQFITKDKKGRVRHLKSWLISKHVF